MEAEMLRDCSNALRAMRSRLARLRDDARRSGLPTLARQVEREALFAGEVAECVAAGLRGEDGIGKLLR